MPVLRIRTDDIGRLTEVSLDGQDVRTIMNVTVKGGLDTGRLMHATVELYVALDFEGHVKAELKCEALAGPASAETADVG